MTINRILVLIVLALFAAAGLAACELSASTPPPAVTGEGPMGTLEAQLAQIATQTAAAGGSSVAVPTATTPPMSENPTPTEGAPAEGTPVEATPTEAEMSETGGGQATTVPTTVAPTAAAPAATAVPVFTATPGIPATYVVQPGEFPYCLARRFNVNPTELLNLNGVGSLLQPGMTLKIPQTGNPFPGTRALKAHPTTYTVVSGDTIYTIACQFGDVDPNAIIQANALTPPYTLTPGQTIHIP
jgi:LysM repeat protein